MNDFLRNPHFLLALADATAINFLLKKVSKTGLLILDHCVPADSNRSMWLVLLRQASIPGKEQPLWLRLSSITWPNLSKIFNCSWLIKAMDDWKLDAAHWRNESTFVNYINCRTSHPNIIYLDRISWRHKTKKKHILGCKKKTIYV